MEDQTLLDIKTITKQVLEAQKAGETGNAGKEIKGSGIALLKNFSLGSTNSGKPKFTGTLSNVEELRFSAWNNSAAFEILSALPEDATELVVKVEYTISKYGFVISMMETVDGYQTDDFIYHRYNLEDQGKTFCQAVKDCGASESAIEIIKKVLHMGVRDEVNSRIGKEYAALSHHDNCTTGLLAHMTKCLEIYQGIKREYAFLNDSRTNDLMVISIAVHDVGKIHEMHNGVYQKYSFVTHRGLGAEYLMQYKEEIVTAYNEEFYYMILSVILQHHGEYGENPRTLYAMLVHRIDDMEATLTSIDMMLENDSTTTDAAGRKLKFNDAYLNVLREV